MINDLMEFAKDAVEPDKHRHGLFSILMRDGTTIESG